MTGKLLYDSFTFMGRDKPSQPKPIKEGVAVPNVEKVKKEPKKNQKQRR